MLTRRVSKPLDLLNQAKERGIHELNLDLEPSLEMRFEFIVVGDSATAMLEEDANLLFPRPIPRIESDMRLDLGDELGPHTLTRVAHSELPSSNEEVLEA